MRSHSPTAPRCLPDGTVRKNSAPSGNCKRRSRSALAVSGFRLRTRLGFSIPSSTEWLIVGSGRLKNRPPPFIQLDSAHAGHTSAAADGRLFSLRSNLEARETCWQWPVKAGLLCPSINALSRQSWRRLSSRRQAAWSEMAAPPSDNRWRRRPLFELTLEVCSLKPGSRSTFSSSHAMWPSSERRRRRAALAVR